MSNDFVGVPIECCVCKRKQEIGAYIINGKRFLELRILGEQLWLKHGDLFFCSLSCGLQWADK